jgi:hypothetical protein
LVAVVGVPLFTLPVSLVPVLLGAIRIAISKKSVQLINRPLRAPSFDDDTHFCCIPFYTPRHRGRLIIRRELPRAWTSFVTDSASFTWQLIFREYSWGEDKTGGQQKDVHLHDEECQLSTAEFFPRVRSPCYWTVSAPHIPPRPHRNPMRYAVRKAEFWRYGDIAKETNRRPLMSSVKESMPPTECKYLPREHRLQLDTPVRT